MLQKFSWILPAHFYTKKIDVFEFDLTTHLKTLIANKFWDRKIHYEKLYYFSAESLSKINSVKIRLFPYSQVRFHIINHYEEIFKQQFPEVPEKYKYITDRGNLRSANSLAVVEIEFESEVNIPENIVKEEEFSPERYLRIDIDFNDILMELISVSNEMTSLFMTVLHLTFPTINSGTETLQPETSGLMIFGADNTSYYHVQHSDILTHPILIEPEKFEQLNIGLDSIASIWHKDLWTIHRLLKALRSDFIDIDNFLDLIFTLESLFPNNTSSESMRMASAFIIAKSKEDASAIDLKLKIAFTIRNEVAHGGMYYRIMDKYTYKNKEYMLYMLFWDIKSIVINLIIYAILKLLKDKKGEQNCLRINNDDIYNEFFSKEKNQKL